MVPVAAQVTYSVFPAKPTESSPAAPQPTGLGLSAPVTLMLQDSTLEFTVRALAHQARLRPVFDKASPIFDRRVSVRIVEASVKDAFATVLQGTGLVATLAPDGESVVIRPFGSTAAERSRTAAGKITGHVTDSASGAGLGGAQVRIEGIKLSTVTSDSGHFTLKDVPVGDQVLSVKLFGYRPAERTVNVVDSGQSTVRIVMVPVPTVLSGVVTTATGLQRKVEVGNDITSLNVDSIMQVAPITSVTDLLETRVPGLTILHSSGVPGDPSRLRLRGDGSAQLNNDPIVIVDGVRMYASQSDPRNNNLAPTQTGGAGIGSNGAPGSAYAAPSPLDQIDPNDIETIDVFKGPSASALYGSDAANGVIVITLKHGRTGPTHWNLALADGVNWLPGQWPKNYYIFGRSDDYSNSSVLNECQWNSPNCVVDSVIAFQALDDPRYAVFSHGSDQTASLTVSGGVPTLQYSVSGSVAGNVGNLKLPDFVVQQYDSAYGPIPSDLVRPDNYTTWGVSGSLTAQPTPTARVTLQSSLFNSTQQRSSLENSVSQLEGEFILNGVSLDPYGYAQNGRPLVQNEVEQAIAGSLTSTNSLSLSWQPRPWLPLSAEAGVSTVQRNDNTYIPYGINAAGPGASIYNDTTGSYGLGRGTSHNQTLSVGTAIPLFHQHMTLALGGNAFSQSTADFSVITDELAPGVSVPTSFTENDGNGVENSGITQSTSGETTYGWYIEPRLNFASRFFVAPGFRLDGGSAGTTLNTQTG
ncbi:MAG TPA: carboxypeptidase regulatory-like domain-containing protein, partial [Gemmatimonadaceae bacterium]|nr:carboxypeptidase regulatory-like domain-containing protein [Gemmatimonadaceae bacterium]